MSKYFLKPYECFCRNIRVKLDIHNYATKADFKGTTGADASNLAAKSGLAWLKTEEDEIDVDKLKTVPIDFSKPSNAVDTDVVKKTVYNKLVAKCTFIDNIGFVLKAQCNNEKSNV